MKIIEWSDIYRINVSEIDKQHEKLFSMLNALGELTNEGKDFSYILNSLKNYADIHFSTEEKYLDKYNLPQSDTHKNEHVLFREKINRFIDQYATKGSNVSKEIINFLKTWLEEHIKIHDKKLGPYLNEKGTY